MSEKCSRTIQDSEVENEIFQRTTFENLASVITFLSTIAKTDFVQFFSSKLFQAYSFSAAELKEKKCTVSCTRQSGGVADAVYGVLDIDTRQGNTAIQSQGLLM